MRDIHELKNIAGGLYLNYSLSYAIYPETTDAELAFLAELIAKPNSHLKLKEDATAEACSVLTETRSKARDTNAPKEGKLFAQIRHCLFCEHDFYWFSVQL